jgi:hypothetical protein
MAQGKLFDNVAYEVTETGFAVRRFRVRVIVDGVYTGQAKLVSRRRAAHRWGTRALRKYQ